MIKNVMILILAAAAIFLSGCQQGYTIEDPNMQVTVLGTSEFPQQVVGLWWCEKYGWAFRFDEAGRIVIDRSGVVCLGHKGTATA